MSLINRYLKDKRKPLAAYLLVNITFLAVCSLNQLDNLRQILYAAVITGFIGLCYGIYDFLQYRRHYRTLHDISPQNTAAELFLPETLPAPQDSLQEQYQKRMREMQEAFQNNLSDRRSKESDMMDYYLMWAHQIKTPIAAMKLLIQNGPSAAFMMEKELFKIESYVEMVLHYLRLESISSDMLLKQYDIYELAKNTVKKYALLFIDKKITLHLQPFNHKAITDEKWFSFVLEQLLSNAIKYTPDGEISIYMQSGHLIIEDTGIGIRAEDLPRIYERGFTGYNGRMDKKSTGIGLYLCKQVTDRLGIPLNVTSQQGKGTQVLLNLNDLTEITTTQ